MGYMLAIVSSLFFTLYALGKKYSKVKPYYYVLYMGISFFISSLVSYFLLGNKETIFDYILLLSFLGGAIWFIASVLFFETVDKIGISKASQFKSLQGPIGSILILTILSEYMSVNVFFLLLAIVFIFISAFILIKEEGVTTRVKLKYIFISLTYALLYGVSAFIRKVITLKGYVYSQQIYNALGVLLSSFIYISFKEGRIKLDIRESYKPLLSGILYYLASFFMLKSYECIEGAIAFTIIQLNSIYSALIGIFIFKEIDCKKYYKKIIVSLSFLFFAIILLIISR